MPLGHLFRLRATAHASTLTLIYAYHEPAYRTVPPAKEHELKRTHLGAMHQAYADEFSDTSSCFARMLFSNQEICTTCIHVAVPIPKIYLQSS